MTTAALLMLALPALDAAVVAGFVWACRRLEPGFWYPHARPGLVER